MLFLVEGAASFCRNTASIWGVVGWLVLVLKIVIPILLIIYGMLDLGKAVIASDDKAINNAVNTLLHRFIAAVIVFFIPTIVSAIFNAVTSINVNNEANLCIQCITDITGHRDECSSNIKDINWNN